MSEINIKIEGVSYKVEEGLTILEAAKKCGYEIPSLCAYNHGECSRGSCRVCLVEATGARGLVASCVYPVSEGMEITISSPKAVAARRASVELLLSNHSTDCQQCDKNEYCELLHVARITGAREGMFEGEKTPTTLDELTPSIVRDTSKCILCGRCIERCKNAHGKGILGFENRGFATIVAPAENRSFANSPCIPHEMFGAIVKSYYAEKNGIDPADIFVVSIMPCTAKKFEKEREQLKTNGFMDVDAVLTTRELAKLIKRSGINFKKLPDEEFDADLLGDYTGAGVIFGVTGGVMEAALRTAYHALTGKEHELIKFEAVRGFDGIREASLDINGTIINVAVAHGMKNAKDLLDDIRAGKSKYHFIEIMGCPGGCIAGGGQPYVKPCFLPDEDIDILDTYKEKRAAALYSEDERNAVRQSHNNMQVKALYDEFLGEPNSHKAHELLHTTYAAREGFND